MQQQLPRNYSATFLFPAKQRVRIARSQQRDYEGKPWNAGLPTHDILGNALCFNDQSGNPASRYWVVGVTESGAHIRKDSIGDFSARAPTEAEALEIGNAHASRISGRAFAAQPAIRTGAGIIVKFHGSARSLD